MKTTKGGKGITQIYAKQGIKSYGKVFEEILIPAHQIPNLDNQKEFIIKSLEDNNIPEKDIEKVRKELMSIYSSSRLMVYLSNTMLKGEGLGTI